MTVVYNTVLNWRSDFYKSISEGDVYKEHWFEVPYSAINVDFKKDDKYIFSLEFVRDGENVCVDRDIVIGAVNSSDKINDSLTSGFGSLNSKLDSTTNKLLDEQRKTQATITEQTNAIKENNETNKNIFQKIGEMLSYINPFSENFFAYKLVDLFLNMLKSLFIPNNEFFSTYFEELNIWFSDRLGFLYYPFELFFSLCDKFLNINFSEPIINIPNIVEPSTNTVLIHAREYNFNVLLENNILKTVHDIYLVVIDAFIFIGLVMLLYKKYEEVLKK